MSKRKRPRNESSDTDEESSTELTPFQIVEGLSHFWAPGSRQVYNDTLDTLRSVQKKPSPPPPDKDHTRKYPACRRRYRDWIDFCKFEDSFNRLGNLKTDFKVEPHVNVSFNKAMSRLQYRYLQFLSHNSPTGLASLDANLKRYFLFVSMAEHESQQGSLDDDYEISMVGDACWTPAEKRRFFDAVERCSRGDVVEISRRVGPTKTTAQVAAYLNVLDKAAKGLRDETIDDDDERYSAREMSPFFMVQETRMSTLLNDTLETESHAKHQQLLSSDHEKVTKALELFEVWNMSSLSRLFAGTNDLTILCSTLVQYHELLESFIKEILGLVYTELLSSGHSIVDRTVINHIIAKRQKTMMEKPDVRFKDLDIIAMLDKRKRYHQLFSNHKSASFLAKRRRKGWEREASNQQEVIHLSSDSENESEGDCSDSEAEFDSDQDDMLVPFDDEDGLDGYYYAVDDGVSLPSGNEDKDQEAQISQSEETEKPQPKEDLYEDQEETKESQSKEGLNEDEIDLNEDEYDSDSSDDDELVEMRMKELDSTYEQELMKSLGFYTKQDILDYEQTKKQSKDIVKPLH